MKKGLLIVHTGNGKGKSTAALGLMFRAWGRGMRVAMLQFIKSGTADYGEYRAAEKTRIEILSLGDGCEWESPDMEVSREINLQAWEKAQKRIVEGKDDLIVLDEFTFLFHFGWLEVDEVLSWIKANKPEQLHLVITGRYAPEELLAAADIVTEMIDVKHHYKEQGLTSQPGVDR